MNELLQLFYINTYLASISILLSSTNECPDRLPTVSAAQALLRSSANRAIPTGLEPLDEALSQKNVIVPAQDQNQCSKEGGISRGHVTEVFGVPGAGKTTLASV